MVTIIGDPDGVPESGVRPDAKWKPRVGFVASPLTTEAPPVCVTGMGFCGEAWASDPAALLGPVREPVNWNPRDEGSKGDVRVTFEIPDITPHLQQIECEWNEQQARNLRALYEIKRKFDGESTALEWLAYLQGKGSLTDAERAREGKAWRALGYPERDVALVAAPGMPPDVLYDLRGATLVCEDDEPLGVYERNAAGDEEC